MCQADWRYKLSKLDLVLLIFLLSAMINEYQPVKCMPLWVRSLICLDCMSIISTTTRIEPTRPRNHLQADIDPHTVSREAWLSVLCTFRYPSFSRRHLERNFDTNRTQCFLPQLPFGKGLQRRVHVPVLATCSEKKKKSPPVFDLPARSSGHAGSGMGAARSRIFSA